MIANKNKTIKKKKSPLLAFRFADQRQKIHPAHKIYGRDGWRARVAGEPERTFTDWRRREDSNL